MPAALNAPRVPQVNWLRWCFIGAVSLILLYAAFLLYQAAEPLFGALLLALATGIAITFGPTRGYSWRFVFPAVAAVLIFIAFPVTYTIYLGFTNSSSFNLLSYERAVTVLMSNRTIDKSTEKTFQVGKGPDGYRLWFPQDELVSGYLTLDGAPASVPLLPGTQPPDLIAPKEAVKLRAALQGVELIEQDGTVLRNSGLRGFAIVVPEYQRISDTELKRVSDGALLTANPKTGFFETEAGERVPPGWRVTIGFDNFRRIFANEGIRGPMVSIFVWTVTFAVLSTALVFAIGVTLASILQWPHLRGKAIYRVLLILPYAVPSFISILVFKGLFNQNFGEINYILKELFGLAPNWNTNAFAAKATIVIVNAWLGYPYMMLLAMGFLQGVPEDHKKAAALEGASPLRVFFTITLPQILPPFVPMLISAFAFNFNNIVLILLLTRGGPDRSGTLVPAGETDILGSFTYRLAFMDSGTQFGLAGAITLLIFVIVAVIAYANFVAIRRAANRKRYG